MKLISVERLLFVFRMNEEKVYLQIPIDVPLDYLKTIIEGNENDEILYMPYELTENQLEKLMPFIEKPIIPDFDNFVYFLDCNGIYDW